MSMSEVPMAEPTTQRGGSTGRPEGGGLSALIGPEVVASVLSVAVVVALLASRLAFTGGPIIPPSSPSPSPSAGPAASAPAIDPGLIGTLIAVNNNLQTLGVPLDQAVKQTPNDVASLRGPMVNMQPQLSTGIVAADVLAATPGGAKVGAALRAVYDGLDATIADTLTHLVSNQAAFLRGAQSVLLQLKQLPPLTTDLTELLTGPSPAASPLPTPAPTPSAAPSPSPTVAPSETPIPVEPTPTPLPSQSIEPSVAPGPNMLLNPGFEAGVGPPWQLLLADPSAQAVTVQDGTTAATGKFSARVDIAAPSNRLIAVSEQQGGLTIEAGAYYQVTVSAKATAIRDIRIRIIGSEGQLLGNGSNVVQVGTTWAPYTFPMTSFAPDSNASIAIDVGGNGGSVWIDDVSVARIPPNAP